MTAHTSGRWHAVGYLVKTEDGKRADICSVDPAAFGQSSLPRDNAEMMANARLIAAAPELLYALQRVIAADDAHSTIHAADGDDVARMLEYGAAIETARAVVYLAQSKSRKGVMA